MAETQAISAISSNSLQMDFMNLLVTQLQNQDPLDPMKNEELTMQLATLSQLQQMETLSGKFSDLLSRFEVDEGNKLIGRVVDFIPEELGERVSGAVSAVNVKDGVVSLTVGPYQVGLNEILAVWPYTGQKSSTSSDTTEVLTGDLNSDGKVDGSDREILVENYGMTVGATWAQGDLNGDGAIDAIDLQTLMESYTQNTETEQSTETE
jgi:flagellar basal-body rod modification protein FlgD